MAINEQDMSVPQRKALFQMHSGLSDRVSRIERRLKIIPAGVEPPRGVLVLPVVLKHFVDQHGVEIMQYVALLTGEVLAQTTSGREHILAQNYRKSEPAKRGMVIQVVRRDKSPHAQALDLKRRVEYVPKRVRKVYTRFGNDPEDPTDDWPR